IGIHPVFRTVNREAIRQSGTGNQTLGAGLGGRPRGVLRRGVGSVENIGRNASYVEQFLDLLYGRVAGPKRRGEGEIMRIEGTAPRGRAPPFVDARGDLLGPFGIDPQRDSQTEQVLHRGAIHVELGGFGDDLHTHVTAGEQVIDGRGATGNPTRFRRHGEGPEFLDIGPVNGAGGEVIAAQAIHFGGGAVGLPQYGVGERKGDGCERGGEPEHRQESAAPLVGQALWPANGRLGAWQAEAPAPLSNRHRESPVTGGHRLALPRKSAAAAKGRDRAAPCRSVRLAASPLCSSSRSRAAEVGAEEPARGRRNGNRPAYRRARRNSAPASPGRSAGR